MKKISSFFNPLYLVALLMIVGLSFFLEERERSPEVFYGFAQNKETEINLDYPVRVDSIFVKAGDRITEGTRLLSLTQINLQKEISDEQLDVEERKRTFDIKSNQIKNKISLLNNQLETERKSTQLKLDKIEADYNYKKTLTDDIKSFDNSKQKEQLLLNYERTKNTFTTELSDFEKKINLEIEALKSSVKSERQLLQVNINRHLNDVAFTKEKMNKLAISSPNNALVGNLHIRVGEYISSFKTMITLYEQNPTTVSGFIHESMAINVLPGDQFVVQSAQDPSRVCQGVITGLGSRIVEIPERLRKIPEQKTFGQEVLLSIPSDNGLLQKEKVLIYRKEQ